MQSLFLTEEDVFEIKIFVAEDEDGTLCCDLNKEGVKFLLGENKADIEGHVVTFKKPSFGDMMELTNILLFQKADDGQILNYDINPITAKVKTISFLIRDWDFVDSKGIKIEATEENIMKLNPIIAAAISIQLEDYLREKETEENLESQEKSE